MSIIDRRAVLGNAITTAALVITPVGSAAFAETAPDPVFAAIAVVRCANERYSRAVLVQEALEATIPRERRQSDCLAWELTIAEGDAPDWIEHIRELDAAEREVQERFNALLEPANAPRSTVGLSALLTLLAETYRDGMPDYGPADADGIADHFIVEALGACASCAAHVG